MIFSLYDWLWPSLNLVGSAVPGITPASGSGGGGGGGVAGGGGGGGGISQVVSTLYFIHSIRLNLYSGQERVKIK